jgi:hypothetical protein
LLKAAFAMEILDLISRVHLVYFITLPKYLKCSTRSRQWYGNETRHGRPTLNFIQPFSFVTLFVQSKFEASWYTASFWNAGQDYKVLFYHRNDEKL